MECNKHLYARLHAPLQWSCRTLNTTNCPQLIKQWRRERNWHPLSMTLLCGTLLSLLNYDYHYHYYAALILLLIYWMVLRNDDSDCSLCLYVCMCVSGMAMSCGADNNMKQQQQIAYNKRTIIMIMLLVAYHAFVAACRVMMLTTTTTTTICLRQMHYYRHAGGSGMECMEWGGALFVRLKRAHCEQRMWAWHCCWYFADVKRMTRGSLTPIEWLYTLYLYIGRDGVAICVKISFAIPVSVHSDWFFLTFHPLTQRPYSMIYDMTQIHLIFRAIESRSKPKYSRNVPIEVTSLRKKIANWTDPMYNMNEIRESQSFRRNSKQSDRAANCNWFDSGHRSSRCDAKTPLVDKIDISLKSLNKLVTPLASQRLSK